jgi:hypothetical protein
MPTRSLRSERGEKASACSGRDDGLGGGRGPSDGGKVKTRTLEKRKDAAPKGHNRGREETFLSSRADAFAGSEREEKASARSARNDSLGDVGRFEERRKVAAYRLRFRFQLRFFLAFDSVSREGYLSGRLETVQERGRT